MSKHQQYEDMLNRHRVTWEYRESVRFQDIDPEPVWRSQVRLAEVLDENHATKMMMALAEGRPLPALILRVTEGKFPYEMIDGRHRTYAADIGDIETHDAYVVYCSAGDARALAEEANDDHGKPYEHEENLAHAAAWVAKGLSVEDAARKKGVKVTQLRDYQRRNKLIADLRSRGMSNATAKYLSQTASQDVIKGLNTVVNKEAQRLAAELIQTKNIKGNALHSLIMAIKEGEKNGNPIEAIDFWRNENTEKSRKKVSRQPKYMTNMLKYASGVLRAADDITSNRLNDLTSEEIQTVWNAAHNAKKSLQNLERSLNDVKGI